MFHLMYHLFSLLRIKSKNDRNEKGGKKIDMNRKMKTKPWNSFVFRVAWLASKIR